MIAINIKWDIDDNIPFGAIPHLPTEVEIPSEITDLDDAVDWLSDEYGFCIISLGFEEDEELTCPYCLGTMIGDSKNGLHRCFECGNEF